MSRGYSTDARPAASRAEGAFYGGLLMDRYTLVSVFSNGECIFYGWYEGGDDDG